MDKQTVNPTRPARPRRDAAFRLTRPAQVVVFHPPYSAIAAQSKSLDAAFRLTHPKWPGK